MQDRFAKMKARVEEGIHLFEMMGKYLAFEERMKSCTALVVALKYIGMEAFSQHKKRLRLRLKCCRCSLKRLGISI